MVFLRPLQNVQARLLVPPVVELISDCTNDKQGLVSQCLSLAIIIRGMDFQG